jgi:hypothetical protein
MPALLWSAAAKLPLSPLAGLLAGTPSRRNLPSACRRTKVSTFCTAISHHRPVAQPRVAVLLGGTSTPACAFRLKPKCRNSRPPACRRRQKRQLRGRTPKLRSHAWRKISLQSARSHESSASALAAGTPSAHRHSSPLRSSRVTPLDADPINASGLERLSAVSSGYLLVRIVC